MSSETPQCGNCLYYHEGKTNAVIFNSAGGMCRRYAPQGPAIMPSEGSWQSFPPTAKYQWCGDYRPKYGAVVGAMRVAAE